LGVKGNTVEIGLTEKGRLLSDRMRADPLNADLTSRSDIILNAVGAMSATKLKDFVYAAIPEIIDMKWGEYFKP